MFREQVFDAHIETDSTIKRIEWAASFLRRELAMRNWAQMGAGHAQRKKSARLLQVSIQFN